MSYGAVYYFRHKLNAQLKQNTQEKRKTSVYSIESITLNILVDKKHKIQFFKIKKCYKKQKNKDLHFIKEIISYKGYTTSI